MNSWRTSFAFSGGGEWDWYKENGKNVPYVEIKSENDLIEAAEGPDAARDFRKLIKVKLDKAERGELNEPEDGRPYLARQPGVMELKWGLEDQQWRLYYCEPLKLYQARVMLGLLFGRKVSKEQQDGDIDDAAARWTWWQSGD